MTGSHCGPSPLHSQSSQARRPVTVSHGDWFRGQAATVVGSEGGVAPSSHRDWFRSWLVFHSEPTLQLSVQPLGKAYFLLGLSGAGQGLSLPPKEEKLPGNEAGTEK